MRAPGQRRNIHLRISVRLHLFTFCAAALIAMGLPSTAFPQTPLSEVVSAAELRQESTSKLERIHAMLQAQGLKGVLLTRQDNFAWVTAGLADNHIVITSEQGAASLLVMADGSRYLVGSNSEVPRHMREDLAGLGWQPEVYRWYQDRAPDNVRKAMLDGLAKGATLGTDTPEPGLKDVSQEMAALRYQLLPSEIKKYRWVGRATADAVEEVARSLHPGVTELQMEAAASGALIKRGLRPTVLLMGVDQRVVDFYHHTPTTLALKHYAFVNVCARRWGLVASVGRFVYLGSPPSDLTARMAAAALLSAKFQAHTKAGVTAGEMIAMAKQWYAEAGYPDDWQRHHQGGAIGYAEREWIAVPGGAQPILNHQAFAWNPILRGTLSFDTLILQDGKLENLTATPTWPTRPVQVGDRSFLMPDILVVPE